MAEALTRRAAIDKVLGATSTPLHYNDIAKRIIADRLRTSLGAGFLSTRQIGCSPAGADAAKMIPALEAILIEALEPRQNRKRGDDLSAVEFIQHEDPKSKTVREYGV